MIQGIVLAAGLGRRVGGPKALLALRGVTFLDRARLAFSGAGLDAILVINPQIENELPAAGPRERRVVNVNPDQAAGMFSSVRLGVNAAISLGAEGVILLPVDHPLITGDDVGAVANGLFEGAAVVVPTHGGRRGHPIGLSRLVMEEIATDPSIETLRDVVRRIPGRVLEVAGSEGTILGVNTKEDLDRVLNRPFR